MIFWITYKNDIFSDIINKMPVKRIATVVTYIA